MKSAKEILDIINAAQGQPLNCSFGKINTANIGIRTDVRELVVGDEFGNSLDSDTEEDLGGTCAVGYSDMLWGDDDDIKTIQTMVDRSHAYDYAYSGTAHKYLIVGTGFEYGNDDDEVIIYNAEVLACLD